MSSKSWKKIEQSNAVRKVKLRLRQAVGTEPRFQKDVDIPMVQYSGWHIPESLLGESNIAYSLGVCDDIGFERDIIRHHSSNVFAFDPTPYSIDWIKKQDVPDCFSFYPWAASEADGKYFLYPRVDRRGKKSKTMFTFRKEADAGGGVEVEAFSVPSIAKKLGHATVDILKMDIEGAEYGVLYSMLKSEIRPKILLVEFHHRFKGIGKEKTVESVSNLRESGYLIADISVTGREFCFVMR